MKELKQVKSVFENNLKEEVDAKDKLRTELQRMEKEKDDLISSLQERIRDLEARHDKEKEIVAGLEKELHLINETNLKYNENLKLELEQAIKERDKLVSSQAEKLAAQSANIESLSGSVEKLTQDKCQLESELDATKQALKDEIMTREKLIKAGILVGSSFRYFQSNS